MPAIICPHCGQLNPAMDIDCSGCRKALCLVGSPSPAQPRPLDGASKAKGALSADLEGYAVTTRDYALLAQHAESLARDDLLRDAILEKLERCAIVLSTEIAEDVVTLNSRVAFSVDGRPPETRFLVHREDHATLGLTLPVTTPLGISMLGAVAGDTVTALRRDGSREIVDVIRVPYQPEAARRLLERWASRGPADWPPPVKSGLSMNPQLDGPDDPGPEAA